MTSTTAVGLVWLWIYSPQGGLLNELLGVFGIPPQRWVSDPFWAMPSIIVMSVWQGLGVERDHLPRRAPGDPAGVLDAASVDGAGRWSRFRHVTLPLLTPSIFFTGILALIGSLQVFDQVYILARPGKPTEATITLVYFIYEEGFRFFRMGSARRGRVGAVPHRGGAHHRLLPDPSAAGCTTSEPGRAVAAPPRPVRDAHRGRPADDAALLLDDRDLAQDAGGGVRGAAAVASRAGSHWENYARMWNALPGVTFGDFFLNSLKIATLTTVGAAGHAARWRRSRSR